MSAGQVTDGAGVKRAVVESHSSRIGIKGSTALDNGMEATYGVELGVNLDGDAENTTPGVANALTTRNTFVGLKGNFGEVRVGKHDTPAKLATGGMDVFADTYGDMNRLVSADTRRAENAVAYINKFGPVGVAYAHVTDLAGQDRTFADGTRKADSLMLNYSNGSYIAALGHTVGKAQPVNSKLKETNVGLGWKSEAGHKANFVHETSRVTVGGVGASVKTNLINGVYKVGNVDLKAQYGQSKIGNTGVKETLTTVGADYNLGKKTAVYGLLSENKFKGGAVVNGNINKAAVVGVVTEF
jgi:predicted porin